MTDVYVSVHTDAAKAQTKRAWLQQRGWNVTVFGPFTYMTVNTSEVGGHVLGLDETEEQQGWVVVGTQ